MVNNKLIRVSEQLKNSLDRLKLVDEESYNSVIDRILLDNNSLKKEYRKVIKNDSN